MNKLIFISLIFFVTLLSSVHGDRTTDRLNADPRGEEAEQEITLERRKPYVREQSFYCEPGDTRCEYIPVPRDVDREGNRAMAD
ncbi:MAG: hypothetical protein LW878_13330 [Proteobacteria bacterium]|nr:hypothetical protein [Pseudomonadota bacterium]